MTTVTLASVQALAASRLGAHADFAGVEILLEAEESATAAQLDEFDARFERALNSQGVAVVVLSPELANVDKADHSGLSTKLAVAIAICENPQVNRGEPDAAANPRRLPANKSARRLIESAIATLLPEFEFPPQPAGRPTWDDGFWAYYLVAQRRHVIRAAS